MELNTAEAVFNWHSTLYYFIAYNAVITKGKI